MVVIGLHVDEETVLASWAEAELYSPRYASMLEAYLGGQTIGRLRAGPSTGWAELDRNAAVAAIRCLRAPLIEPLRVGVSEWNEASVANADLPELRTTKIPGFRNRADDLRLTTLLDAVDTQRPSDTEGFTINFRDYLSKFEKEPIHGRPILVTEKLSGPYVIAEGTTRLVALLSFARSGRSFPAPIPVYVGHARTLDGTLYERR
jgi:hypothetical protein